MSAENMQGEGRLIRFSEPTLDTLSSDYVLASLKSGFVSSDGPFSRRAGQWLSERFEAPALLAHSCTAALEIAAHLANLDKGDEVIMPSFTFSSTANAFVLRGATPVFVDVRADTLNMDEGLIEQALSPRTRAIVPVHYAGIPCEMDVINGIASQNGLTVIEDAAQAFLSDYRGKPAGTLSDLGCFSFHATKNIMSGEGGALIVNRGDFLPRAQVIQQKGTNRIEQLHKSNSQYCWTDVGSSYAMSDVLAALLLSQLERSAELVSRRRATWQVYHRELEGLEQQGVLRRPFIPDHVTSNFHGYFVLLNSREAVDSFIEAMAARKIQCVRHYPPLHSSQGGRRFGRVAGTMAVTDQIADRLVRLPLHANLTEADVERVLAGLSATLR